MSTLSSGQRAYHYSSTPQTVGWLDNSQEIYHSNHRHPEVELVCLLSGNASILIGSQLNQAAAGDVFLIGGDLVHAIHCAAREDTEILSLHFKDSYFADVLNIFKDFQPAAHLMSQSVRGLLWRNQADGIIPKILRLKTAWMQLLQPWK